MSCIYAITPTACRPISIWWKRTATASPCRCAVRVSATPWTTSSFHGRDQGRRGNRVDAAQVVEVQIVFEWADMAGTMTLETVSSCPCGRKPWPWMTPPSCWLRV
ncbi:MAG: hypothetical protein R3A10_10750 [Caldilineaceae bacterium]